MRQLHRKESGRRVKTVIALSGMPGAGKSLAARLAQEDLVPVFVSGDMIRLEAKNRGLKPTRTNLGRIMLDIRKKEGMGAVARRVKPLIDSSKTVLVLYEGPRSMEELEELAKNYSVVSVAIHSSPETRYKRLVRRKRSDQPRSWSQFLERDERELSVGLGRVLAYADRMIENAGTKDELRRQMRRVLRQI